MYPLFLNISYPDEVPREGTGFGVTSRVVDGPGEFLQLGQFSCRLLPVQRFEGRQLLTGQDWRLGRADSPQDRVELVGGQQLLDTHQPLLLLDWGGSLPPGIADAGGLHHDLFFSRDEAERVESSEVGATFTRAISETRIKQN